MPRRRTRSIARKKWGVMAISKPVFLTLFTSVLVKMAKNDQNTRFETTPYDKVKNMLFLRVALKTVFKTTRRNSIFFYFVPRGCSETLFLVCFLSSLLKDTQKSPKKWFRTPPYDWVKNMLFLRGCLKIFFKQPRRNSTFFTQSFQKSDFGHF